METLQKKPRHVNIRISMKAYQALSRRAKKEKRTISATLDLILKV